MADPKNYISTLTHNGVTYTFEDTEAKESIAALADIASSGSWNDLSDTPTTLNGYGITDAYTKTEIDGKIASSFHYKGSVNTYDQLPASGNVTGDVWNVATADTTHGIKAGDNVCWDGTSWDILAGVTDLSVYDNHIANTSNPHQVTKAQVGLGNVDNTSDENKPISTATQTALDGKVDKVTSTSSKNRFYVISPAGNQTTIDGEQSGQTAATVAIRTNSGTIRTATPSDNNDATTKKYVDDADALKVDKVSTASRVYGTDSTGAQTTYDFNALGKVDDVKVAGTSVVTNKIANLGSMASETASDYSTKVVADTLYAAKSLETTVSDLDLALSQEVQRATDRETALNTKIEAETTRATGVEQALDTAKADKATTYTKTEVDGMLSGAMHFKGAVATIADLNNIQNPSVGDLYNVSETGANYAWDGTQWVKMAENVDLSAYALTSYVDAQDQAETSARQAADALKVDKVTTPSRVYGTDELGQPITYGVALFGNIDDVTVGGTSVVNNRVAPLGSMAGETASDYYKKTDLADIATSGSWNDLSDTPTTISGYGITDAYTKSEIDGMVSSTFHYKGTKTTYSQLPTSGNVTGDVWNIEQADTTHGIKAGDNVCWNGTSWDVLAGVTDLSVYDAHIANTSNPHNVTKTQVGLGNVDNTSDLNKPISTATQTALDGKVDKVSTASRVYGTDSTGAQTTYDFNALGKVDDVKVNGTSVVTNKVANITLGTMAGETASDYSTKAVADTLYAAKSLETTVSTHLSASNPHNITKSTVGLGNVDNTSDLNKPISTATQTALNAKQNTLTPGTNITISSNTISTPAAKVTFNNSGTETSVTELKINKLTQAQYEALTPSDTELYYITDADAITIDSALSSTSENPVQNKVINSALNLKANASDLTSHTGNTSNPHNVTKAQVGLGNVNNTADMDKPVSTATQTALNAKVDKVSSASKVYGTDANGDQTTYDYTALGKVDDVKVGTTSVVTNKIATLGTMAGETASNYYTKTIADSTFAAKSVETSKVDKVSTASKVYGTDSSGSQTTYSVSDLTNTVTDVKIGTTSVVSSKVATLGTMAGETASDYYDKNDVDGLLDNKQGTITGAATTIVDSNLTASRVLISNASGKVSVSDITSTELGYLDNVSSNIQTQLNGKVAQVSTASKVYGTDAQGNQTTYNADSFGKVDDVKVGTTSVVTNKIATLGTMAGETAANYSTKAVADTLYASKSIETSKVDKVSTASKVYGTDASGNQTTYSVNSFGNVDDVTVGGTSAVTNKVAALGSMAGETATNYYTKTTADSTFAAQSTTYTKTEVDNLIDDFASVIIRDWSV